MSPPGAYSCAPRSLSWNVRAAVQVLQHASSTPCMHACAVDHRSPQSGCAAQVRASLTGRQSACACASLAPGRRRLRPRTPRTARCCARPGRPHGWPPPAPPAAKHSGRLPACYFVRAGGPWRSTWPGTTRPRQRAPPGGWQRSYSSWGRSSGPRAARIVCTCTTRLWTWRPCPTPLGHPDHQCTCVCAWQLTRYSVSSS